MWLRCVLLDIPHALAVPIRNQRAIVPDKHLVAELGLTQVAGVVIGLIGFVLAVTEVTKGDGPGPTEPPGPKVDGVP